jgi:dCMP deaminase
MITQARVSWEKHAMTLAYGASLRSEDPFRKVGACALDYHNGVLGVSYNGLMPGFKPPRGFWSCRNKRRKFMIHAETNLLSRIKVGQARLIAVTLLPCRCCAINIAAHQIKHVVFGTIYEEDHGAFEIFKFYGIEISCIPAFDIKNTFDNILT